MMTQMLLQAAPPTTAPPPSGPPPTAPTSSGTQAQGSPQGGPLATGCAGQSGMFLPMIAIFVVFYFMLIRPQQKKQRETQDWLKSLKKGDDVVTTGGVIGRISGLTDNTVTLEVQEKVRLKVLRSHIAGKPPAAGQPAPEPEKK
jgi:preprotein translocase subunit YajC